MKCLHDCENFGCGLLVASSLVGNNHIFGGTYHFHLQDRHHVTTWRDPEYHEREAYKIYSCT